MTFEYKGVTYKLVFQYGRKPCPVSESTPKGFSRTADVWAKLYVVPAKRGDYPVLIGLATCARADVFCKEVGRKVAVEHMLSPFYSHPEEDKPELVADKGFRQAVWFTYLHRNEPRVPAAAEVAIDGGVV